MKAKIDLEIYGDTKREQREGARLEMEMDTMTENKSLTRVISKSLDVKSLKDLVRARSNENPVLLIDVSGSMGAFMRNGKTRIDGLRQVVSGIQAKRLTQMIAFGLRQVAPVHPLEPMSGSGEVAFVQEVPDAHGGTPLAEAIDFARINGFGRAVIVSDGGRTIETRQWKRLASSVDRST
jgi:uncharacterized protein with von Willebrand factor type A (vWA) domain